MNTPTRVLRFCPVGLFGLLALASVPAFAADAPAPAPIPLIGMSVADVTKADNALKQLLIGENPALKDVFAAHPEFTIFKPNTAIVPAPFNPQRHDGFVEIAKKGDIDLLFAGDSITDWWALAGPQGGKDVFAKYFGGMKVANFAIAGDTTEGVLYRLQNGEGQGFQPKAIMLMIGTNNIGRNTATEIADGIISDLNELRKDFPNAKILLLGVFPRSTPGDPIRKTIADINAMISKLGGQNNITYMDIGAKFLGPDGAFAPGTFRPDNLHPMAAGYEIWAEAVKDKIAELMK